MNRVKLDLPDKPHFTAVIPVRITDVNYGGHVGNDSLLSILHEARVQFLQAFGFSELNIGGTGIIMSDAVLIYKGEVFYGDSLEIDVGIANAESHSADITYRVVCKGREVVRAKTGIVFFDYSGRKIVSMPPEFKAILSRTI